MLKPSACVKSDKAGNALENGNRPKTHASERGITVYWWLAVIAGLILWAGLIAAIIWFVHKLS